jgi:hypothetical protein
LPRKLAAFDLVHLKALGMGRSRWRLDADINKPPNVCVMHRPCHQRQEATRGER